MATNLTNSKTRYSQGNDSIVIMQYDFGVPGGRSLDMTGFTGDVIRAGHVIIKDDAAETYKPMPISSGAYGSLPSGYSYFGVCTTTALATKPMVGIMTKGVVNQKASPYTITSAIKTALSHILFSQD